MNMRMIAVLLQYKQGQHYEHSPQVLNLRRVRASVDNQRTGQRVVGS